MLIQLNAPLDSQTVFDALDEHPQLHVCVPARQWQFLQELHRHLSFAPALVARLWARADSIDDLAFCWPLISLHQLGVVTSQREDFMGRTLTIRAASEIDAEVNSLEEWHAALAPVTETVEGRDEPSDDQEEQDHATSDRGPDSDRGSADG